MNNANGSEKWRPITITNASNRMRTGRSMPEWMTKSGKGGPLPPPPPSPGHERNGGHRTGSYLRDSPTPDPDYEVIECPTSTQYMNSAPPPLPAKNPENGGRRGDGRHCDLCGSSAPGVRCEQCNQQIFCMSCDEMYHRHPKRQTHVRKPVDTMFRPPLPPKGESAAAPVPPPRRNKRPGSALSRHGPPSPLPPRKEQVASPLVPSAILDRMGSLKRMMSNTHRPLPATPVERPQASRQPPEPPRPTPGATLDSRLSSLQERYRQHQEAMRSLAPTDRNRRDSSASRPNEAPLAPRENFNDWETPQTPRLRSGSVSGLHHSNSMRSNVSPPLSQVGSRAGSVRGMSASTFDLNRAGMMSPGFNPNAGMHPGFNQNPMQQAQSLLNCMNCQHGMWPQSPQLTGSNMSLNMPAQGYHPHDYPPPVWMGPWGQPMYPGYPMGMMPPGMMNNGTLPRRRASSRPVSPTLSLKSRKSHVSRTSRRQGRNAAGPVMADDEESDEEDDRMSFRGARHRRESLSSRRRHRLNSATHSSLDDDIDDDIIERESLRSRNKKQEEELRQPRRKSSIVSDRTNESRNQRRNNVNAPRKVASSASDNESLNQPIEDDGTPLGPPPSPPSHEWECEHCTFLNAAGVAICGVCCKTPSGNASRKKSVTEDISENFSRQMKITSAGEDSSDGRRKGEERKEEPTVTESKQQNILDGSLDVKDNISIKSDNKQESKQKVSSGCGPSPPREIVHEVIKTETQISTNCGTSSPVEIVPEVSRNETKISTASASSPAEIIPKTTKTKSKISTGCGPSPPREIVPETTKIETKSEPKSVPETTSVVKHTTSTGTSPPPQSISTQTYEELPSHIASREKEEEEHRPSTRTPRVLRRSHSMHFSRRSSQAPSPLHRSLSRQSFSSDAQSLPNTPPRELSPTRYDDEILAIAERALSSRYQDHSTRNYRSILDLRRPELYQPRRPSYADSRWADSHQARSERGERRTRAESQPPDSILEDLINKRKAEVMKTQGMELVRMLREAEQNKYTAEELQAALAHCSDGSDPVAWLKENWSNMIDTVRTLATNYGHERRENTVGTLSAGEARDALRQHRGNVWAAVTECVEQRQRKYAEIMSRGNFTREDIITSLTAHHGDSEAALMELNKSQLKPFLMRIWGPPAGMENDSANNVIENNQGNNIPSTSTSEGALAKLTGAMSLGGDPGRAPSERLDTADRIALKDFVSDNADKQLLASEAAIASTRAVSIPPQTNSSQEHSMPPGESHSSTSPNHRKEQPSTSAETNILNELQAALITIETNQKNSHHIPDDALPKDVKSETASEVISRQLAPNASEVGDAIELPSTAVVNKSSSSPLVDAVDKLDNRIAKDVVQHSSSSESSSENYEEPLIENIEISSVSSKVSLEEATLNKPLMENLEIASGISAISPQEAALNKPKALDNLENIEINENTQIPASAIDIANKIRTINEKDVPIVDSTIIANQAETPIYNHPSIASENKEDVQMTVLVSSVLIDQQNNGKEEIVAVKKDDVSNAEINSSVTEVAVPNKSKLKKKNRKKVKQKSDKLVTASAQSANDVQIEHPTPNLTEQISNMVAEVNELQSEKVMKLAEETNEPVTQSEASELLVGENLADTSENKSVIDTINIQTELANFTGQEENVQGTSNESQKVSNNIGNDKLVHDTTPQKLDHNSESEIVSVNKSGSPDESNITEMLAIENIETESQISANTQTVPQITVNVETASITTTANSSKKQAKPKSRIPVKRTLSNPKTVKSTGPSLPITSTDVHTANSSIVQKENKEPQAEPQKAIEENQTRNAQLLAKENDQQIPVMTSNENEIINLPTPLKENQAQISLISEKGKEPKKIPILIIADDQVQTSQLPEINVPSETPLHENQQHASNSLPIVGKEQTESLNIVQLEDHQNLDGTQNPIVKKSGSGMKILEVIVSNTSEDSEDELYSGTDSESDEEVQDHLPQSASAAITIENNIPSAQSGTELSSNGVAASPPANKQQNLSKIVEDTQRIIKQMKDEINSDIASYVSEGERNSEGSSYESSEYSGSDWSGESDSEMFSSPGDEEDIEEEGSYEDESGEEEETGEEESDEGSGSGTNVSDDDEEFSEAIENLENAIEGEVTSETNEEVSKEVTETISIPNQVHVGTEPVPKVPNESITTSPPEDLAILSIEETIDSRISPNVELVMVDNSNNESEINQPNISEDIRENVEIVSINENIIQDEVAQNEINNPESVTEITDAQMVIEKNIKNLQNTSIANDEIQNANDAATSPSISHITENHVQQNDATDVENVETDEFILILNTSAPVPDKEETLIPENSSTNETPTQAPKSVNKKESPTAPNARVSNIKRLQQGLMNKVDTTNVNKNVTNVKPRATNIPKRIDTKITVSKFSPKSPTSPTKVELKPISNSSKMVANSTTVESNSKKVADNSIKSSANSAKLAVSSTKVVANPSKVQTTSNSIKAPPSNIKESVSNINEEAGGSKTPEPKPVEKKKKSFFRESCFSDEDISEDEVPPKPTVKTEPNVKTETKPEIKDIQIQNDEEEEKRKTMIEIALNIIASEPSERQARRFLAEGLVRSYSEAELAVTLLDLKFDAESALYASRECGTLDAAIAFLQQECELCTGKYPMNQMVSMLRCVHRCCKECAGNYFTIQITDRAITDCVCPFCKDPDLTASDEDDILDYFSHLDILLKGILHMDVHELFQRKLRDRTLMQDPNFKWCVKCSSGFFAHPRQKRLICPDCRSVTCGQCRRPWEKQHEGISCEQFAEWKEANDPDVQAEGVARHLREHGIDCPKCRFRYALSRGGCMHFTCSQCKYEFCCGCGKPFTMGAKCGVSPYCGKLGLHAHHPRNCLFYLRDKEPHELQRLLKINNVAYDVEPPVKETTKEENVPANTYGPHQCQVQLQKETPGGMVDSVCNADVLPGQAGLCRGHYVEYLVSRVRGAGLDPLPAMDLTECVQELRRRGIALPDRGPWDTDDIYRGMCQKIVLDQIPLD